MMFWPLRKSWKLGRIGRRHILNGDRHSNLDKLNPIERTLTDVLTITDHDPGVQFVMKERQISPATLEDLYKKLIANGAGQVCAGHFVAASALAFGQTLDYLLTGEDAGRSWHEMAYRMIRYFEDKETGIP